MIRGNLALTGAAIAAAAAAPSAWAFGAPSPQFGQTGQTGQVLQPGQPGQIGPSGWAASECWLDDDASAADLRAVLAAIAAGAGCAVLQVPPAHLAAAVAVLRPTPVRVAAKIAGPGALATTKLFDAEECLRLGADEIAWPLGGGGDDGEANAAACGAEIAAAAARCHDAGARLKLLLPGAARGRETPGAALPTLLALARSREADALAVGGVGAPGSGFSAPAGAVAGVFTL